MSSKVALILVGGVFLVALAMQIADRMTTDAINVAVGVLCGMAASVPVSFGLLLALQRRQQQNALDGAAPANDSGQTMLPEAYSPSSPYASYTPPRAPYPQVIVVAPPQNGYVNPYLQSPNLPYPQLGDATQMQERNWKIVGEDEE